MRCFNKWRLALITRIQNLIKYITAFTTTFATTFSTTFATAFTTTKYNIKIKNNSNANTIENEKYSNPRHYKMNHYEYPKFRGIG